MMAMIRFYMLLLLACAAPASAQDTTTTIEEGLRPCITPAAPCVVSATAPASDAIWADNATAPEIWKVFIGGAWQTVGTYDRVTGTWTQSAFTASAAYEQWARVQERRERLGRQQERDQLAPKQ